MWGKLDGRAKIEIVREAIAKLVDEMPQKTMLGLVAYGHRKKGDCDDIEMLIPPGTLDRQTFIKTVNAIQPKGMTPLTAAVEFAAEALRSTEKKATVILVTDGEETCDRDPCQAARALEESGVDFTAHVIAFDLDLKAARTVECMAKETGGLFLTANSATALVDALQIVLQAPAENPPLQDPGAATLSAPKSVIAGSFFEVEWSGPDDVGDYILLTVPEDKKVDNQTTYEYTRQGSPMRHKAIIYDGDAELRYIHGPTQKILAREAIKIIPAEVTLQAKKSAIGGSMIQLEWTGPDNKGDYITIVPQGAHKGAYDSYAYTSDGSPAIITAPEKNRQIRDSLRLGTTRYYARQERNQHNCIGVKFSHPAQVERCVGHPRIILKAF